MNALVGALGTRCQKGLLRHRKALGDLVSQSSLTNAGDGERRGDHRPSSESPGDEKGGR